MTDKLLVIDTNVIVSAFLGRSWPLLVEIAERVVVLLPERVYEEATKRLTSLLEARGEAPPDLSPLLAIMNLVSPDISDEREAVMRWLLGPRGATDWQILAAAMEYGAPIWTRDRDFLGTGVGTWNNRTVRYYADGRMLADQG